MMELLSTQRHEFLNHLQVISGFLQLGKETEARNYIHKIVNAMAELSKVVHLGMPETAAVLMNAHYRAEMQQIRLVFDIQTDLKSCTLPGEQVASLLEEILNNLITKQSAREVADLGEILVSIAEIPETGSWQIYISSPKTALEICLHK